MRNAVRSEVLRALSGLSVLAVYLVALLMPAFVLVSDGSRFDFASIDSATATTRLLEPLAWTAVSAAFVGAYGVTREFYYNSMGRTLTGVGFRRAFMGKLVAGALIAVVICAGIFVLWTSGIWALLTLNGVEFVLAPHGWRIYGGALMGAVLGAVIGGSIGWLTRNYYATASIILVLPMAVEFALLRTQPEIAKYSPGLVLAALGVPGFHGQLLEALPALGIGVAWAAGLATIASTRGRRSSV